MPDRKINNLQTYVKKFLLLALILNAVAFMACSGSVSENSVPKPDQAVNQPSQAPIDDNTDALAMGRELYLANCAVCHRENGTGGKLTFQGKQIKPDDLTSAKIQNMDDDKMAKYIYFGIEEEGMPAFKDQLSEAEIREVIRYIREGLKK